MKKRMLIAIGIFIAVIVAIAMLGGITHVLTLFLVAILLAGVLNPKRGMPH